MVPDESFCMRRIPGLDLEQSRQVMSQIRRHDKARSRIEEEIMVEGLCLKDFRIDPGVFRSDIMTSPLILARFLARKRGLYEGKDVLDLGCGSGLQGLVMGLLGARSVVFSDISEKAVANARANAAAFAIRFDAVQGDLFENAPGRFGLIAFNHPFFAARPIKGEPISRTMLDDGHLIRRFFREAGSHLSPEPSSRIAMPFFHMAGDRNDPERVLDEERYGLRVRKRYESQESEGMQKGGFSIYAISRG